MINLDKLKNKNGISTLVLVIILLLSIVIVGVVVYVLFFMKNSPMSSKPENVKISPEIYLNYSDEGKSLEVPVKITVSTNDAEGIECIVLPDRKEVTETENEYEYIIKANGEYTFTVRGNNGTERSETITISNIPKPSATEPYVPDGFTVIEDNIEEGFVIKDKYGNEFVWVPVEKAALNRTTISKSEYKEDGFDATALNNSVTNYCGFYIGRYEASQTTGNRVMVMPGQDPWVNISYLDAEKYARNMAEDYKYDENTRTAIMSGSAWDTTIKFIDDKGQNFSQSTEFGNYEDVTKTGATESDAMYKIYDLAGNVREWTSEIYKNPNQPTQSPTPSNKNEIVNTVDNTDYSTSSGREYRVIRSGGSGLARTPSARTDALETESAPTWGFRVVLYRIN